MPYATQADMLARFGPAEVQQLTDINIPRLGATDAAVLATALGDASAWIDGYLRGRYPLPITDTGALALLRMHCCNAARYNLMSVAPDEQATKLYEAAERYLVQVAQGKINLVAPDQVPAAAGAGSVIFNAGSKVFGRDGETARGAD